MRHDSAGSLADVVGSLQERGLLDLVFRNPDALNEEVAAAMQPPLAAVEADESVDEVFAALSGGSPAVVVATDGKPDRDADPLRPARVPGARARNSG